MFSFIIGLLGVLVALIGWFGFKSLTMLIVGTALYVVETFMEWHELNTNAKLLDLVIFGIGCLVSVFIKVPFYIGGMVAINCYSALNCLIGIPMFISQVKWFFRR